MAKCAMKLRPPIVTMIILLMISVRATLALSNSLSTDLEAVGANVTMNASAVEESVLLRNATHHVEAVGGSPGPRIPFEIEKTEANINLGGGESNTFTSSRHDHEVKQFVPNDTQVNRINCRQMGDVCVNYVDRPLWHCCTGLVCVRVVHRCAPGPST